MPDAAVHTVLSGWTRNIIALAAACGASADDLWRAGKLDPENLGDELLEEAHLRVWRAIMATLRRDGFPVHVASQRTINDYALLGLACKTARTVGEAVDHLIRYLSIWNQQYRCQVRQRGESAELVLLGPTGDLARRCTNESAIAQILKAMRDVCRVEVKPVKVSFRHPAPGDVSEHEAFFACPLEFAAAFDGIELSRETLESELPLADDALSDFLIGQLESMRAAPPSREAITDKVRREISHLLPGGPPRLDEVARRLGVTGRSLQRQLAALETTFVQLIDDSRRDIALELLESTPLSVAEISFALGFSEPSAFHRAFKRWTGATPASFRGR